MSFSFGHLADAFVDDVGDQANFPHVDHQRNHDFGEGLAALLGGIDGRADYRLDLHLGNFRVHHRQAATAETQHGIHLGRRSVISRICLGRLADALGQRVDILVGLGQEFVQRRIQQADCDRQSIHHLEQFQHIVVLEIPAAGPDISAAPPWSRRGSSPA